MLENSFNHSKSSLSRYIILLDLQIKILQLDIKLLKKNNLVVKKTISEIFHCLFMIEIPKGISII